MTDPIGIALREWNELHRRLNASPHTLPPTLANAGQSSLDTNRQRILSDLAAWSRRWCDRQPPDIASTYFRICQRRDDITEGLHGAPDPTLTGASAEAAAWLQAVDLFDIAGRPDLPAEPFSYGELAAWLDKLQLTVREHSRRQVPQAETKPPPAIAGQSYSPSSLAGLLDISLDTLRRYALTVGVQVPQKNQRGFLYPEVDALLIAEHAAHRGSPEQTRVAAANFVDIMRDNIRKRSAHTH